MGLFDRNSKTADAISALANAVGSVVAPVNSVTVEEVKNNKKLTDFLKPPESKHYLFNFRGATSQELILSLRYFFQAALPKNAKSAIGHSSQDRIFTIDLHSSEEKEIVERIEQFTQKIESSKEHLKRQRPMALACSDSVKTTFPEGTAKFAGRTIKVSSPEAVPFLYVPLEKGAAAPRFGVRMRYLNKNIAEQINGKLRENKALQYLNAVFNVGYLRKICNETGIVEIAYAVPVESPEIKDSLDKLGVSLPKKGEVGQFAGDMTPLRDAVAESVHNLGPLLGDGYEKRQDESTKVSIDSQGDNFVVKIDFSGRVQKLPSRALDTIMRYAQQEAGIALNTDKHHTVSHDPTNMGKAVLEITVPQEEAKEFTKAVDKITKKIMDSEELKAECKKGTEAAIAVWESSGKVKPQLVLRIPGKDEINQETHFFLRIENIADAVAAAFRTALPPLDSKDLISPRAIPSDSRSNVLVLPLGQTYPDAAVEALKQALEQGKRAAR